MKKLVLILMAVSLLSGCSQVVADKDSFSTYYDYGYRSGYVKALEDIANNADILTDYAYEEGVDEGSWEECSGVLPKVLEDYWYGIERSVWAGSYSQDHVNKDYIPDIDIDN